MKVVHKLVVTHTPEEMEERIRYALLQLGCPDPEADGEEISGTAVIGRDRVDVTITREATPHGHEITVRAVDQDTWSQPARVLIRRFGDHYWKLDEAPEPRRNRGGRSVRKRRGEPRWKEHWLALAFGALCLIGLILYLLLGGNG